MTTTPPALTREQAREILSRGGELPLMETETSADRPAQQTAGWPGEKQRGRISPARRPAEKSSLKARVNEMNKFVDKTMESLEGAEARVWVALWRDVQADTGLATTGQAVLARKAGVKTRQIYNVIRQLTSLGLVEVVRKGRPGTLSQYRVRPLITGNRLPVKRTAG